MRHKKVQRPITIGDDMSYAMREAYNLLRANLDFSLTKREDGGGHVIAVTSACPQEGKSCTSVNLAYTLACAGHKVLLLDGDMRMPSLQGVLGVPSRMGLSNILAGQADADVKMPVLHTGMDFILAGDCPPNPSELIGSASMEALLAGQRASYDYIIVDTPPVLPVSDALALSKYIDGFIVVVRHGVARRRDVRDAVKALGFSDTKVLGFVYNDCPTKRRGPYHSGYRYEDAAE